MVRLAIALGALGMMPTLLTGCSAAGAVNDAALQRGIATGLAAQVGESWAVTCPDAQPLGAGITFTCRAVSTTDGLTVTILVTEADDRGNVAWETVDAPAASSPAASSAPPASTAGG